MEDVEVQYIAELVAGLISSKFTGSLQINLRCGGITNINKSESILRKDFVVSVK